MFKAHRLRVSLNCRLESNKERERSTFLGSEWSQASSFPVDAAFSSCGAGDMGVIDNILVRIHFIIVMIRWTGLVRMPPLAAAVQGVWGLVPREQKILT